jgi:hypothetical protein
MGGSYTASVLPVPEGYSWALGLGGAGGGRYGGYGVANGSTTLRAFVFSRSEYSDVTPEGYIGAIITDSANGQHAGGATFTGTFAGHAFLWNGTTPVNVHPSGYAASQLLGIGGQKQSGLVVDNFFCNVCNKQVEQHAGLWNGTAESFRLLHAKSHINTAAMGTDGIQVVGQGIFASNGTAHALLWNAGATFAVNLNPGHGYSESLADCVSLGQQAGTAWGWRTWGFTHAALWRGTPSSFVDLNPDGFFMSQVRGMRNGVQVGIGTRPSENWKYRALAWNSTPESATDLHALLPARYQSWNSSAEDVDPKGNIIGFVELEGKWRPVIWKPVATG